MLNADEIVKLLLGGSFSFAIVIIAWQVARLIAELVSGLKDLRFVAQAAKAVVEEAGKDYKAAKGFISNLANVGKAPANLLNLVDLFKKWQPKNKPKKDEAKSSSE